MAQQEFHDARPKNYFSPPMASDFSNIQRAQQNTYTQKGIITLDTGSSD